MKPSLDLELAPLNVLETGAATQDALWLRGGFPSSVQAPSDARSLHWRENFIRTYLERDIPQFGPRIAAETLRRFWTMLAHHQGGLLNVAQLARNLGVDVKTAQSYIGLLCDLLLLRRLPPWHTNTGKRLVKAPKVYVRDSGLLHALLGIGSGEQLLSHMVVGASWEGHCLENLLSCAPRGVTAYFYRTSAGAEIDLLLVWPGGEQWAIEFKRSLSPKVGDAASQRFARLLQHVQAGGSEQQITPRLLTRTARLVNQTPQHREQPRRPVHLVKNHQLVQVPLQIELGLP